MRKENKMGQTKHKDIWQFLEDDTIYHPEEVKALFEWSLNYDHSQRPFNLMLDLIGYSEEHYGAPMSNGVTLGYLEADYLGDALKEWANYPQQVEQWITDLFNADMGEED
jgi:hypothetical protein